MLSHPWLLVGLMLAASAGSQAGDVPVEGSFTPAQGWILVRHGSVAEIEAAVRDYDGLAREARPKAFRVEFHPQSDGTVAVLLPDGFPAYDLANMTGWLSAPPDQENVHDAACWIASPGDGARYYLEPEASNPLGDTLVGASLQGRRIRVYLPETGISEISASHSYEDEPKLQLSSEPASISITLDASTAFGNPMCVANKPKDHDWRR